MKGATGYLLQRLLQAIPTLLGVLIVVFFFVRALPGDPARLFAGQDAGLAEVESLRERLGLTLSVPRQFVVYVSRLAQGDLGVSFRSRQPVERLIQRSLVPTLYLALAAIAIAVVGGVLMGSLAALRQGSFWDLTVTSVSVLGISVPSFFLGLLLIYVFAVAWGVLPVSGSTSVRGLVLPAITLGLGSLGTIARFTRSSVLEVLGEDYIRTARAKGRSPTVVITHHALRNALIPVLTVAGLQFGSLVSGAVIVETIFNLPGLGWLLIQSIDARDYPVIQALMLVFSLQFLVINLVVDLLYAIVDPRISYG